MVYIIVVGMPGSGKDVFVTAARRRGFGLVRMGDVVRSFAKSAGLAPDDVSVGGFADRQRTEHGPDIWAERTLKELEEGDAVIDGSRSLAEIERFRAELGDDLVVVGVVASADKRFERLMKRGRADDPVTKEMFEIRDSRELSWGLQSALDSADISIVNEGELRSFETECESTLDTIQKPGGKKY